MKPAGARILRVELPFARFPTYELETRYDNADRPIERVYPDGRSLSFAYDDASRTVAIPGVIDETLYSPQGLHQTWRHSNGAVVEHEYDQRLRLATVTVRSGGDVLQSLKVDRDRANNVLALSDAGVGALRGSVGYAYAAW